MSGIPKYLLQVAILGPTDTEIEIKPGSSIGEPIFLRTNLIIYQKKFDPITFFSLAWLTISQCQVKFMRINFKCKIQVTAKSEIIADDCVFTPYDKKCECAVEIFANSSGNFTNCHFRQASKAAIAVRDRSKVTLNNCTFSENSNTSVLVLDKSRADIISCHFSTAERFSIYLYRGSISYIFKSDFLSQNGKAVFMLTGSEAHIIKCNFKECKGGGVSIADSSKIYVNQCGFNDIGSSSIHAMKNSEAKVKYCNFETCKGNGVNFEYSTGCVYKCKFSDFDFPAIACFGPKATPVIYDSVLSKCHSIAVVSRDCASPTFSKLILSDIESHGFSISDFSNTIIESCTLKNIKRAPFCVFNGATPEIKLCSIYYENSDIENLLFQTFTKGKVVFKKNTIFSDKDNFFAKVHNYGIVDTKEFVSNYFYQTYLNNENENINQTITSGFLITIDEKYNLQIDKELSQFDHPRVFFNFSGELKENTNEEEDECEIPCAKNQESGFNINDPPNSVRPNISHSELMSNPPKSEAISLKFSGNSIIPIFSLPPHLPEVNDPKDLPQPLPEVDISFIMQNECQIEDDSDENNNENRTEGDVDAATIGHLHAGTCMRCDNGKALYVIIPCGHKVLCKKCAEECTPPKPPAPSAPNQKPQAQQPQIVPGLLNHTCPLCDTPIQRCTEEYVEQQCVICLENKCDTIILPCGHRCICYDCATRLWTEKKQCPLCQTRVLSFRHMFQIYSKEQKMETERRFALDGENKDEDLQDKPDSTDQNIF